MAFIGNAKLPLIEQRKRVQPFVPDLAIEIVSENGRFNSLMEKADRYRACGTKEVWVLAPDIRQGFVKSATRHTIVTEDENFESELIPGFSIRLGDLFDQI